MAEHAVALQVLPGAMRTRASWERLACELDDGRLAEIDGTGVFEARVEADDFEGALRRVWDAIAAAGVDDDFAFAEHPSVPEHWRHRADGPPDGRG